MSILDYFDWITPAKSLVDTALGNKCTVDGDQKALNDALQRGEKVSNVSFLSDGRVVFDVEVKR